MVDTPEGRSSILDGLITRAALDALVEICSQPEDEGAENARGSRRRRGSRRAGTESSTEADESTEEAPEDNGDSEDAGNDEAGHAD